MTDPFTSQYAFKAKNRFCLGVEEEVWTVSPETGLLVPAAIKVFADPKRRYKYLKPELPAQQIEMVTPICRSMAELDRALRRNERRIAALAKEYGFAVSRSPLPEGPFSITVYPTERYKRIAEQQGDRLRGAYVAGLHVHVGLGSKEEAIRAMNACRTHLPGFLAISARSPNFMGADTGYASYRYVQYKTMAGDTVPPFLDDWEHFRRVAAERGFHEAPRNCWWALRISPHGTIELRVTDIQEERERTLAIAGLFRALVKIAVESPHFHPRQVSVEDIDRWLYDAARGKFDPGDYLDAVVPGISKLDYTEELKHIRRYA